MPENTNGGADIGFVERAVGERKEIDVAQDVAVLPDPELPSLSTCGETLTIEESMTLGARTENAGDVGDEHEWSWSWSRG